ncbi:hypothetical protein TNCV_255251 [Trichonephila clavipes]|nr:hypothetical protein TNCV_255251 [Trichonephila clavipes]
MIEPQCLCTVATWNTGSMAFMSWTSYSQPSFGFKKSQSRLITPCYSFPVFYTPVSVLSYLCKTCSPMASIEQWYCRRSMAPETYTVKQALHIPFTDYIPDTVIQLGGNVS